jgi:hypothetical protein
MQDSENIAGGMSYRTMNGVDTTKILKYLNGSDKHSSHVIIEKNKAYYIASANKTIARLELAKRRVDVGYVEPDCSEIIYDKIISSLKWLEELKNEIKIVNNKSELLKGYQYKKWHAVKLVPSACEGLIITSSIKCKIEKFGVNSRESTNNILKSAIKHNEKAETIFLELLELNEQSNFKEAEISRIKGYGEAVLAEIKLNLLGD